MGTTRGRLNGTPAVWDPNDKAAWRADPSDGDVRLVGATECSTGQSAVVRYGVVIAGALAAIADSVRNISQRVETLKA